MIIPLKKDGQIIVELNLESSMTKSLETGRNLLHISMIAFALLIGYVPQWVIVFIAFAAILFNWKVLPFVTSRSMERKDDEKHGFSIGLMAYPIIVFCFSIIFYHQPIFLLIGWGAMAFGDGFAGFFGRRIGNVKLPYNDEKSLIGLISYLLIGGLLTYVLLAIAPSHLHLGLSISQWFMIVVISVSVAGISESVDIGIDDNIRSLSSAALIAFLLYNLVDYSIPPFPNYLIWGIIAVLLFVVLSIASKKISISGGIFGGILAFLMFLGSGFYGVGILGVFFFIGSLASLLGYSKKKELGLAQKDKSKRGIIHAFSNAFVAAVCGVLAFLFPDQKELFILLMTASIAEALSDTLSSEIGSLYGQKFRDIISFKRVARGTDGGISLAGNFAGIVGALIIAIIYALVFEARFAIVVFFAGFIGNIFDSIYGSLIQNKGLMDNHIVNFTSTLSAAFLAYWMYILMF